MYVMSVLSTWTNIILIENLKSNIPVTSVFRLFILHKIRKILRFVGLFNCDYYYSHGNLNFYNFHLTWNLRSTILWLIFFCFSPVMHSRVGSRCMSKIKIGNACVFIHHSWTAYQYETICAFIFFQFDSVQNAHQLNLTFLFAVYMNPFVDVCSGGTNCSIAFGKWILNVRDGPIKTDRKHQNYQVYTCIRGSKFKK